MARSRRSNRTLLKFRVIPLVRMPKSVLFRKVRDACRNGVIPDDIQISSLQWDHKRGNRYMPGERLNPQDAAELKACYGLLVSVDDADVRFERPDA